MKFLSFPRTTILSAALSIASLTGSVGSCAINNMGNDKPQYKVPEDQARFCYHTLGEITCYTSPQPNMGEIVAYDAERVKEPVESDLPDLNDTPPASAAATAAIIPNTAPVPPAPSTTRKLPVTGTIGANGIPVYVGASQPIPYDGKPAKSAVVKKKNATKKAGTDCKPCADGVKNLMEKPKTVAPIKEPVAAKEPTPAAAPAPAGADGAPIPLSNQAPSAP